MINFKRVKPLSWLHYSPVESSCVLETAVGWPMRVVPVWENVLQHLSVLLSSPDPLASVQRGCVWLTLDESVDVLSVLSALASGLTDGWGNSNHQTLGWINASGVSLPVPWQLPTMMVNALGQTADGVVMVLDENFALNTLAQGLGVIRGGGFFLGVLTPAASVRLRHGAMAMNASPQNTGFFGWLARHLLPVQDRSDGSLDTVAMSMADQSVLQQLADWIVAQRMAEQNDGHYASAHVLWLKAKRGRGKSTQLGRLLAENNDQQSWIHPLGLLSRHAWQRQALYDSFVATGQNVSHESERLKPLSLDTVVLDNWPTLSGLVIEEAASLPLALVKKACQAMWRQGRPVWLVTTSDGYEGSASGFEKRLWPWLQQQSGTTVLSLQCAHRWNEGDALERWGDTLCQVRSGIQDDCHLDESSIQWVFAQHWDWSQWQQAFDLLQVAHYQTQPDDWVALLESARCSRVPLVGLVQQGQLLACLWWDEEATLDLPLAQAVHVGQRRVKGCRIRQTLLQWVSPIEAPQVAQASIWRIKRVAVHPALQRQGLGRRLLQQWLDFVATQSVTWVGVSFAVDEGVLAFWSQAGFVSIKLGFKPSMASGAVSMVMMRSVSSTAKTDEQWLQRWGQWYDQQLHWRFADGWVPSTLLLSDQPWPLNRLLCHASKSLISVEAKVDVAIRMANFVQGGQSLAFQLHWLLPWWQTVKPQFLADDGWSDGELGILQAWLDGESDQALWQLWRKLSPHSSQLKRVIHSPKGMRKQCLIWLNEIFLASIKKS